MTATMSDFITVTQIVIGTTVTGTGAIGSGVIGSGAIGIMAFTFPSLCRLHLSAQAAPALLEPRGLFTL